MAAELKKCNIFIEIEKPSYDMIFSAIKDLGNLYGGKEFLVDLIEFIPDAAKDKMIERAFREASFREWLCKQINDKVIANNWKIAFSDVMVQNIGDETIDLFVDVEGCSYVEIRKILVEVFAKDKNEYLMTLGLPVLDILFETLSDCGLEESFLMKVVEECNPVLCKLATELINKELIGKTMLRISIKNLELILM